MEQKSLKLLKGITKLIIISLMFVLVFAMLLGTFDLFVLFYKQIVSPDPFPFLIKIEDLYATFTAILIIVVGYELFKSMILILNHDKIPVKPILKIASIALANKIIALNIKDIEVNEMFGLSALIVSVGIAFFFYNRDADVEE